jgi:hypothetical protein
MSLKLLYYQNLVRCSGDHPMSLIRKSLPCQGLCSLVNLACCERDHRPTLLIGDEHMWRTGRTIPDGTLEPVGRAPVAGTLEKIWPGLPPRVLFFAA